MKKNLKKRVKKNKFNWFRASFRLLVVLSTIFGIFLLIHDFICYAIVPFFDGMFYQVTYFGMFVEIVAIGLVEVGTQLIKEWL